jgi:hypothetical protein
MYRSFVRPILGMRVMHVSLVLCYSGNVSRLNGSKLDRRQANQRQIYVTIDGQPASLF